MSTADRLDADVWLEFEDGSAAACDSHQDACDYLSGLGFVLAVDGWFRWDGERWTKVLIRTAE